jgi:hypothetical protein
VLEIALTLLLTAHLLLVDVAMGGPLACVWLQCSARRRGELVAEAIARRLAVLVVWALAGGSILGGLLLALRYVADDRAYLSALAAIPSERIWFGLVELVFSFACLTAYVALRNRWRGRRVLHPLLAIAGATNLMVHFPALFAIVSVVSTRRELAAGALDRAAYRRLLVDGEVLARVAHVWLAAAAVTGVVIAVLAMRTINEAETVPEETRRRLFKLGAWLALAATLVQFPVGLWVVLEMPEAMRMPLLGGDWLAFGLFMAALVLVVHLLYVLLAIALGDDGSRQIRRSVAVLLVVMLLMVATRLRLGGQARVSAGPAPRHAALASGRSCVSIEEFAKRPRQTPMRLIDGPGNSDDLGPRRWFAREDPARAGI